MDICINGFDHLGSLQDLPEVEAAEKDGHADVGSEEAGYVPVGVAFADEDVETVEEYDYSEVGERDPGHVGLEGRLEDEGVAVNALSLEGAVEADVGETNTAPGE